MTTILAPNLDAFITSFNNVTIAIDKRDYNDAISEASVAIDDLTRKLLVDLLDKRAHARGMKSRFSGAVADAEQIIEYAPRSATGYLRAGQLYAQQGKQLDAIRIYKRGITKVPLYDPRHAQLIDAKKAAEERSSKRIDFVKELPMEVAAGILRRLPLSMNVVCDQVSHAWRARLCFCPEIWKSVKYHDKKTLAKVCNLVPRIGLYIEDISLYATDDGSLNTCFKYLNYMKSGCFLKLRSLSLSGERACKFGREHVAIALWQLRFTLRCLTVNFCDTSFVIPVGGMTLEGILMSCPNLTDLKYLSNQYSIVENLSNVDPGHPLVNFELTCTSIDGATLKTLLQKCTSMRRLVLIPESASLVVNPVDFCWYKNLEIFGCYTAMVPNLSEEQRKANPNGLRTFRMTDDKYIWAFMRLVHNNMKTLEDLEITLSSNSSVLMAQLPYDDLKFENLQHLKLSLYPETQEIFLNAIRDCTNLMDLDVLCEHDLSLLIDTLLHLPPLKRSLCIHSRNGVRREGCDLTAVFDAYLLHPNCTLKCVEFHRSDAVTGAALEAMAQISTLEEIVLDRCYDVTTAGLETFFDKLKEHNKSLTSLKLAGMISVQNSTIIMLSKLHSLQFLELKRLENITDKGIIGLADDIDLDNCSLELLTVNECWDITIDSINHVDSLIPTLYISHS